MTVPGWPASWDGWGVERNAFKAIYLAAPGMPVVVPWGDRDRVHDRCRLIVPGAPAAVLSAVRGGVGAAGHRLDPSGMSSDGVATEPPSPAPAALDA